MDHQAQHTPRKDGTDGKKYKEQDSEKETVGQEVGTGFHHQKSSNLLGKLLRHPQVLGPAYFCFLGD